MPLASVKEIVNRVKKLTADDQDMLYDELSPWLSGMKLRSETTKMSVTAAAKQMLVETCLVLGARKGA